MKRYDLATKFLKIVRQPADAASYELKAVFYGNMAAAYMKQGMYAKAIKNQRKSLAVLEKKVSSNFKRLWIICACRSLMRSMQIPTTKKV